MVHLRSWILPSTSLLIGHGREEVPNAPRGFRKKNSIKSEGARVSSSFDIVWLRILTPGIYRTITPVFGQAI